MNEKLLEYFNDDELAANVWLSKYAMEGEKTPDDMHKRMAKEFARIEKRYQGVDELSNQLNRRNDLSEYGRHRQELDEVSIYGLFENFKYIIPQGSIMYGLGRGNPVSLSNCFVIDSSKDSYGGIMLADQEQAQLMKRRGGVGHDLSLLRPKGTKVNNSAKSSTGMASFMHRFSNTTREVAQDGRRGALMLSIDINHPDVMDFIKIKRDGTSVTGANISVKLNDEFMKAVENDEDYILRFPCDVKTSLREWSNIEYNKLITFSDHNGDVNYYVKKIKAKEYWDEIIKSARNYAEPGLMYWDNVLDYDPAGVYDEFKPISSNPCGEQFLQAYDSCRLMAMNLFSFVYEPFTENAALDLDHLYKVSYEQQRLADNLVDLEIEYIDRIIEKIQNDEEENHIKEVEINLWKKIQDTAKRGRRTGCGITALADMLAALNLKYDSDDALKITDKVMKTKMEAELDCNIDLAILRGSFDDWDTELEYPFELEPMDGNNFYRTLRNIFPDQYNRMRVHGRRSVSWSTIAPTGSVSIQTQTSSGCEPVFQPFYMRRKKINPGEDGVRVDFVDEVGDSWQEFPVLHSKFKDWILINTNQVEGKEWTEKDWDKTFLEDAFEESPWYKSTANDIDWQRRNEIQSILQRYTTNAISSTINLPSTVTEQEVSDIYMSGWKLGLKGQTIYVEGSRSGVLVSDNKKESNDSFDYKDAVKRPKDLECFAHKSTSKGVKYSVIVGLLDNKPYEIFITEGKAYGNGIIKKVKQGHYKFIKTDEGHEFEEDITAEMTDEQAAITRLTSTALRHGGDIKFIVEQLNKTSGDMFGFTSSLSRVLKKYIKDGDKSTVKCTNCESDNVIFEEGCSKCLDCGSSKCG